MGDIVLLDEQTINKIAAGEVVDRPSSIVKELVENSIDAKATSVTVEIKKGGISYIRITDNGNGFKRDDIPLAFERHATSKIRKEEDLQHITSMGFRGEALASVAAISKISLTTKNINEDIGSKVRVENGEIVSNEEGAATDGTTIEIYDVFYNVPARFKFLKKDYTEAGYIEDVITRLALSYPSVSFKYINNGKKVIQTSGTGDLRDAIYDIFGKDVYDNVIPIDYEAQDMKVFGMLGLPPISRSTRTHQYTYINNRFVKDKIISSAIDKAGEEKYAISKHPFIVINIYMDPAKVDVNVHPAKLEVKFQDEAKIFDVVYHAVRFALEENNRKTSPFTLARENEKKIEDISKDLINNGVLKNDEEKDKVTEESKEEATKKYDFDSSVKEMYSAPKEEKSVEVDSNSLIERLNKSLGNINTEVVPEKKVEQYEEQTLVPEEKINTSYKYIGNIFDTYIIIQMDNKMFLVDQHAAHERLLFEQIKEAYYSKDRQTQILLVPIAINLSELEMSVVMDNKDMFEKSGFMIDEFGENTIKISGVPNIGYNIDFESMFKDMIYELLGNIKTERDVKEHRFLATLACKAAVKGGMKLDEKEQIDLVDNMMKLDNPFTCPHGRPTAIPFTRYEIERKFMRK